MISKSFLRLIFFMPCLLLFPVLAFPQSVMIPQKIYDAIHNKITKAESKLDRLVTQKFRQSEKQDQRIYRKLLKKDSTAAKNYLVQSKEFLSRFHNKSINEATNPEYISTLDTLKGILAVTDRRKDSIANKNQNTLSSLEKIKRLENQLSKSAELKKFLQQRKEYLKEQLSKFGLAKELLKANKQVYYYAQELKAWKESLKNPKLLGAKLLQHVKETNLFKEFMAKNSMLASLFGPPASINNFNPAPFPGLQTRTQINNLIQLQIMSAGPGAQAAFQQNLQQVQSQLSQLKDQLLNNYASSSDDVLPEGFKPNEQRTKTFMQRLEYGTNIQTQKANTYFPVTSDIGLSIGYKLNNRSVVGIGASFKMGWGSNWNHIKITGQGLSIRSFIDWKIKGSFYLSGSYEQNYRDEIRYIGQLQNKDAWQQSGLIGLGRSIPLKNKFFKKKSVKLLWDFLSYQQVPVTQPFVFRIGYNF